MSGAGVYSKWSIVRGEKETGITLMQMDEGCDTGPVYTMHRTPIGEDMTADELSIELSALAARPGIASGEDPEAYFKGEPKAWAIYQVREWKRVLTVSGGLGKERRVQITETP